MSVTELTACDIDSVASINPNNITKIRILVDESKNLYCTPTGVQMKNCYNGPGMPQKLPNPLKVLYENELRQDIIGGKVVFFYELTCKDGRRNVTATALFNASKTNTYDKKTVNTDLKNALHLQILTSDNKPIGQNMEINIGNELSLAMKGPAGHSINPGQCTAFSTDKNTNTTMWTNTGDSLCNTYDEALIGQNWTGNHTDLSIQMYAFRFVGSYQVTVNCSAEVCPEASNCVQYCVNNTETGTRRRRRNAIITSNNEEKSASVTFRITAQEGSNTSAGIIPSSVVCIVLMLIAVGWM